MNSWQSSCLSFMRTGIICMSHCTLVHRFFSLYSLHFTLLWFFFFKHLLFLKQQALVPKPIHPGFRSTDRTRHINYSALLFLIIKASFVLTARMIVYTSTAKFKSFTKIWSLSYKFNLWNKHHKFYLHAASLLFHFLSLLLRLQIE